ncbi:hypothetical protein [Butyrivibrio sp. INlla16]|uniref:hypothetical protein n=1 Tax=Butyrivibrio sp. INlla16 TaxID=1520807 RepID=UPI000885BC49|nr:hypothetical protein [Butyrivibrio sp. INlla16]SDB10363.1 hypothetical protein SAMN02910263_00477 [Butyrivibrio sp. INlla16]
MNISEKLDFLMNITNTRNSALGKALSFDPSYISRIRSGSRGIPKSQPFSRPVAAYFSRNIKDRYQLETLSKMIRGDEHVPIDEDELEKLIYDWLQDDLSKDERGGTMSGLIDDITQMLESYDKGRPEMFDTPASLEASAESDERVIPVGVFYGNQGKRDSVKRFLSSLLMQKRPFMLYLYSDEDMSWLYENPSFAREWTGLLVSLIKSGSHIQIIHTIGREFTEMMEAIRKWLPLYAMGAIEPYYCPKMRDKIYRRSLFIAKRYSALISTSVGDKTEGMVNFLVRNTEAVSALEAEYQNYLGMCRPLMKMYVSKDRERFTDILLGENAVAGKFFLSSPAPSLWTMPKDIAAAIAKRAKSIDVINVSKALNENMIRVLEGGGEITEMIALPDKDKLMANGAPLPLADMYGSADYRYTGDEYLRHLKHAAELSEKYEGYRIIAVNQIPSSIIMMTHLDSDTIIAGASAPTTVFHISHQQFSYAFYEYLERIEKDSPHHNDKALSSYLE